MSDNKKFKNTSFKKGYNPTFGEFKKSHSSIFTENEIEEAYNACVGNTPEKEAPKKETPKKESPEKDFSGKGSSKKDKS